jgi:large subunit ribosomal protein L35
LAEARGSFLFVDANPKRALGVSESAGKIGATMPKMKTHKASKKRFRVTASGKLKRSQAGKKHLNSPKSGKRKRHLREAIVSGNKFARKYIKAMGGDA